MDTGMRKPFHGITNIIRFNWHFYVIAFSGIITMIVLAIILPSQWSKVLSLGCLMISIPVSISLLASYYIYDYSNLYKFNWLKMLPMSQRPVVLNIHAGFDETSDLLKRKYPLSDFTVLDFYDPKKHTELSIKRARALYDAYPGTIPITTHHIPCNSRSVDLIFNIFALHEIRNSMERADFLALQYEVLHEDGYCIVTEHLRDTYNFLAYTIGFLHFYPVSEWRATFHRAGFRIEQVLKVTPFISVFILRK
jgi:hypothetical protein